MIKKPMIMINPYDTKKEGYLNFRVIKIKKEGKSK